jgi:hypothetical protein
LAAPDLEGGVAASHSLIGNNGGSGPSFTDANGNVIGTADSPIDPKLGPLGNYGGPTRTMALLPGSPAIDHGSNPLSLTTDQRGSPRVVGAQADMGAFEAFPMVVTTTGDRQDTTFDPTNLTLRDAVTLANSIPGPDTITFAPSLSGVPIRLSQSLGELPITDAVTIRGLGAAHTTIDAQGNSRIFNVSQAAGDVLLDGLTLTGGRVTAAGAGGGAVLFAGSGRLTVQDSALVDNSSAGPGGAIDAPALADGSLPGPVFVVTSTLDSNSTQGPNAPGGAIFSSDVLRVTGSTVSGNSTQGANSNGGGLATGPGPAGVALVIDSTLSGNFTQGDGANGGGLFTGPFATAGVFNSTVTLNGTRGPHADGGGIFVSQNGNLGLHSSIVAANYDDGSHPDLSPGNDVPDVTNSLIGLNTGTGLAPAGPNTNGNFIGGADGLPLPPFLGPLADNGGSTKTHALLPGSVAIDHGANPLNLTDDQRGFPRVAGGQADIGAFELQHLRLFVTSPKDTLDATPDPNNLSLRDALAVANNNPGADTITFAPALSGVPIQLTLGQLLITDAVTIQGLGPANTTIDAQQQSRIFDIAAGAGDVTLDGLTLTGGRTTAQNDGGGAIRFLSSGTLVVRNSIITGNSTQGKLAAGGGIYLPGGNLTVSNSIISGNSTAGLFAPGGGIFASDLGRSLTVDDSTVSGNFTQGATRMAVALRALFIRR